MNELLKTKRGLRATAEETIEAELSSVIDDVGLGFVGDLLFPPVDLRFGEPPTILVVSPRDRIELIEDLFLEPDLPFLERARIEDELLSRHNVSALVSDLGGLSTYPFFVSDVDTLRGVLQTTAHEWLHVYFFFRPLGQGFQSSTEMFTLGETAADLAGRELGDMVFARMGGDLSVSSLRYQSGERRDPVFTREMRETRLRTEELLAEGRIEEAEEYMKAALVEAEAGRLQAQEAQPGLFRLPRPVRRRSGVGKPNRGPDKGAAGAGPPTWPPSSKTMGGVSSYQEFLGILEDLKREGT